ncbi:MAG TPA: AAA family ATPase, partial [Catenuloplanes sp.]
MGVTRAAASPLIGRDVEWVALLRALTSTRHGPQIAVLTGEPGIGKTRLLAELARHAAAEGFRTLAGRATEFEQEVPLALAVDALDDHVRRHTAEISGQLEPEEVRRLGDVLAGLRTGSAVEAGPGGSAVERYRCFRALRRLLELLATPTGLVLILDDVHWADPASADFLEYVLRHPPAGPVLLALAYRPAQVPARLAAALTAEHGGHLHPLRLAPLSEPDVARLLGTGADARQARHLYRISGGNPFYLDALRRVGTASVGADRPGDDLELGLAELPQEVRAALAAEVAAVGPEDRLVACAAAVCGYEFEPAQLAAVAQRPVTDVLASLDGLVARDVLQAVTGTGRFRFRHPVVRHVVYASTAAGWRLGAHGRAAVQLERVGAPPKARAHHVARSAAVGDTAAAVTLAAAAWAIGAQAPASAVEWLRTALRLLPDGATPDGLPERGELLTYL